MEHFEILTVASQLDSLQKGIGDFRFDLNFSFYKQFTAYFLAKNQTVFQKCTIFTIFDLKKISIHFYNR